MPMLRYEVYCDITSTFILCNEIDSAYHYYNLANEIRVLYPTRVYNAKLTIIEGDLAYYEQNYTKALYYYYYKSKNEKQKDIMQFVLSRKLIDVYIKLKMYTEALNVINTLKTDKPVSYYYYLSKFYNSKNDFKNSFFCYKAYVHHTDSILEIKQKHERLEYIDYYKHIFSKYDEKLLAQQSENISIEHKRQDQQALLLVVVLLFSLVLTLLSYKLRTNIKTLSRKLKFSIDDKKRVLEGVTNSTKLLINNFSAFVNSLYTSFVHIDSNQRQEMYEDLSEIINKTLEKHKFILQSNELESSYFGMTKVISEIVSNKFSSIGDRLKLCNCETLLNIDERSNFEQLFNLTFHFIISNSTNDEMIYTSCDSYSDKIKYYITFKTHKQLKLNFVFDQQISDIAEKSTLSSLFKQIGEKVIIRYDFNKLNSSVL